MSTRAAAWAGIGTARNRACATEASYPVAGGTVFDLEVYPNYALVGFREPDGTLRRWELAPALGLAALVVAGPGPDRSSAGAVLAGRFGAQPLRLGLPVEHVGQHGRAPVPRARQQERAHAALASHCRSGDGQINTRTYLAAEKLPL